MNVSIVSIARASLLLVLFTYLTAGNVNAAIHKFLLLDHPDGNQNPPPYGLRADKVFADENSAFDLATTFSFDSTGDVFATVNTSNDTFTIAGTAFGGTDAGGSNYAEEFKVAISFTYQLNAGTLAGFDPFNPQIVMTTSNATGSGTLKVLDGDVDNNGTSATDNRVVNMGTKADGNNIFNFRLLNQLRNNNGGPYGPGIEGEGWVTYDSTTSGTHDWLFTAKLVPEPMTIVVWAGLGVAGCVLIRRRLA